MLSLGLLIVIFLFILWRVDCGNHKKWKEGESFDDIQRKQNFTGTDNIG